MAEAWVLDTTLDPAFELGDDEKLVRAASLPLPVGSFVILAKVVTAIYGQGAAWYRLAATHVGSLLTGSTLIAEDKSTIGLFVEYVDGEAVLETVSLSLAATLPLGGFASVYGLGNGSVTGVDITAVQVDAVHLTTHHEGHVSKWHPH